MTNTTTTYQTLPMIRDEEELSTVIIDNRYKIIKRLGFGGQSEVFLAVDEQKIRKVEDSGDAKLILPPILNPKKMVSSELSEPTVPQNDKNLVALKIFKEAPSHKVKHEYKVSKTASSGFQKIVKPKKLKISAQDVQVGEDQYETEMSYIAYEHLGGDSLLKKLLEKEESLEESECLAIFKEILTALKHLHEKVQMAHQDIKPENFVFTKDGQIKLIDLAFATPVGELCKVTQGSSSYMAPEVADAKTKPFNPVKADIFSLGVTLFTMYFGFPPFETPIRGKCDFFDFWCEYGASKYFKNHPNFKTMFKGKTEYKKVAALLQKMLHEDPEKRPESIQEVIDFMGFENKEDQDTASSSS